MLDATKLDLTPKFSCSFDTAVMSNVRPDPDMRDALLTPRCSLNAPMQKLVTEAANTFGLKEGENTMLVSDMPNAQPSTPGVVIVAQAKTASQNAAKQTHEMGVCELLNLNKGNGSQLLLTPTILANGGYFNDVKIDQSTVVSVIQKPLHGVVEPVSSNGDWADSRYIPDDGYFGQDSFAVQVEGGGYKVTLRYFVYMTEDDGDTVNPNPICKGAVWKISQDANGNQVLIAMDAAPVVDSATTLLSSEIGAYGDINITFSDLAGGTLGQTTATTITLDDNAAGNNWFIDTTPADNSEFRPTSTPNEWVAKQGSAAYGKMDMLSVLLHEYGHALGIEHSADSNDYMAPTLTPGVRRLPTAEELALMQQLVGEIKVGTGADASTPSLTLPLQGGGNAPGLPLMPLGGLGLVFLGRLRSNRYGSSVIDPDCARTVDKHSGHPV